MENSNIQKVVNAIDSVVMIGRRWMSETPSFIRTEIMKVFSGTNPERISHYMDKWNGDFADFYLNMDEGMRRKFFTYYHIELEPDKYVPDSDEFYMAMIKEKNKWKVFPFESYAVHLFYLTTYNNSLQLLQNLSQPAYNRITENNIDLYGNGRNWSQAWTLLTNEEKETFVIHLIKVITKQ
jgi:hypothetical protein